MAKTSSMDAPVADEQRLLGVSDIAQRLGVSEGTVLTMARDGRFPRGIKMGKFRKWVAADVNDWIIAQRHRG